jgi:hypothetical protein
MALLNGSICSLIAVIDIRRARSLVDSIFDKILASRLLGRNTLAIV